MEFKIDSRFGEASDPPLCNSIFAPQEPNAGSVPQSARSETEIAAYILTIRREQSPPDHSRFRWMNKERQVRKRLNIKIIIEKHKDGYVGYPIGMKGVVVGQGNTAGEALEDVRSAIRFHLETFGPDAIGPGELDLD